MTKFEEEFKALTSWDWVNVDLIQKILTKFGNWHSDEEFQALTTDLINTKDRGIELLRENSDLKYQLQQQALPVVPEFVAEHIEKFRKSNTFHSIKNLVSGDEYYTYPGLSDEVKNWISENIANQELLVRAWLDGYTVEKPQLFYLKNKLTGDCLAICLARASSGLYVEVTEKWLTRKEQTSYKLYFTQAEIDSMQAGSYEQIEVTE